MREDILETRNSKRVINHGIGQYRLRAQASASLTRRLTDLPETGIASDTENSTQEVNAMRSILRNLISTYLISNGLAQIDRLSMAASVEARTPFVDYQIVEMAYNQCVKANRSDLPEKSFLKSVTEQFLPEDLISRRKRGFNPPARDWYTAINQQEKENFKMPRIVELGIVNDKAIRVLKKPLSFLGRPKVLWLELAVLEMWVRGLESSTARRSK